ncbi:serine/threonine-protein kinase/endoribonuclease IRE1a-like isoform X1 [Cucurbita moschata]|uniref:non-specific serine/threonine protein kinase n=2 Tax=Cucurbita moschata TaxID=3662 RepID=A0A6J1EIH5_CUCMO|nr:serine/threonine-protein kinase/endoribonuclease IRE1a-like isoform X1 [Cucurbita moschata]
MKCCSSFRYLWILLLILLRFWSYLGASRNFENSGFSGLSRYGGLDDSEAVARIGGRSLLSVPTKGSTALIAALDGAIHLVDSNSMKIIWSFSSGPPIYSSHQAHVHHEQNQENASGLSRSFFFYCGDDWELYMHTEYGETKLPKTIDEVVRSSPYIFEDGTVMTGSTKTTVFEVDHVTGELIRSHIPDLLSSELSNEDLGSSKAKNNLDDKDLMQPGVMNPPVEPRLYITRTDYSLKSSFSGSKEVSWSLSVAEIGATLLCPEVENPVEGIPWNLQNNSSYEVDYAVPLSCQSKVLVFRERHVLSGKLGYKRLSKAHNVDNMSLVSASGSILPSQLKIDKHLNSHPERLMLPEPVSNNISSLPPNSSSEAVVPMPLMKVNESSIFKGFNKMETLAGPIGLLFVVLITMLVGLMKYGRTLAVKVKQRFFNEKLSSTYNARIISSKKNKPRKSKRSGNSEKMDASISSEIENSLMQSENNWFQDNNLIGGRRIGKLIVTNKEIAKGSNGTVILEGIYEGRVVAVKRLVKAHHDVASKEVQNLMASDFHQNIVRWYGTESDQDFVYISLERCTCSLDDLIQICSDQSLNSMLGLDQDTVPMIDSVKEVIPDLKLWKENGHPSTVVLKLMRDMVAGLVHLHELGIIHRDLKPQNVLIIKKKSICAKLSDMGISKHLSADMSSLGHRATGCGSSGWQAPEQLLQGRQTRAVDLFSLGCVLFFCITGGRHPFGDRLERDINIVKNQMNLFLVESIPEALDLISQLLNPNPCLRPKASEVLHHPFFWSSEMRLSFLHDTSDRIELEDRETNLMKALENTAQLAIGTKWDEKMEPAFIANIGWYRRYKYDSVRDLLRVMRNKLNHYRELPKEIQELIGSVPEGFDGYFASRFPRLLIEVYKVISQYCRQEECFQKYFKSPVD